MAARFLSIPRYSSRWLAEANALWHITVKNWLYMVRYPSWIIQLIIWPLIFPAAFIITANALAGPDQIGLQYFSAAANTDNYIGFIVIGTMIWMWQNMVLWEVGLGLRNEQKRGTLESNWLSPTWRFSLLIGQTFIQIFTMLFFILVTYLEFHFIFKVEFQLNALSLFLVFICALPSIYGIGFTFASLVIRLKEANSFVFLVRGLIMIFCGISYPISILPGWMAKIGAWIPQTYIIRAAREASLNNAPPFLIQDDLRKLIGFGIFWLLLGLVSFAFMEKQARKSGSIGQY